MPRTNNIATTVHRQFRILQLIPRGRKVDAATIERQLLAEGFKADRRTIQRDLEALEVEIPGLLCDASTRPYGWSWDKNAPGVEIPSMGLETAVMLDLVNSYLKNALPRATTRALKPYFDRAKEQLRAEGPTKMARWVRKVAILPRGVTLIPADPPEQVLEVVYTALLEDCCIRASYSPRGRSTRQYDLIHPLGLVLRNQTFVLVCTFGEHTEICHVLLHRMKHAELVPQRTAIPEGFRLRDHLNTGGVSFLLGGPIALKAFIDGNAAITLAEAPLSRSQRLTPQPDGRELLEATLPDTLELRAWLRSYGGLIEILEPDFLREEFAKDAAKTVRMYRTRTRKS